MTTTFARKNLEATERPSDLTARTPSMRQDLGGTMERVQLLESAVTWPWRIWLCDNSWECLSGGRECRDSGVPSHYKLHEGDFGGVRGWTSTSRPL